MFLQRIGRCPYCKAENAADCRVCWHCHHTLPTWFAHDAPIREAWQTIPNDHAESSQTKAFTPDRDLHTSTETDENVTESSLRLIWFYREHANPA